MKKQHKFKLVIEVIPPKSCDTNDALQFMEDLENDLSFTNPTWEKIIDIVYKLKDRSSE